VSAAGAACVTTHGNGCGGGVVLVAHRTNSKGDSIAPPHQPIVVRGLGRALALAAVLVAVTAGPALAETPSEAAAQIRQIEESGAFTAPTPHANFSVGTFNAATGSFSGTVTRDVCAYDYEFRRVICEPGPPPQVTVNGVHVGFTVRWQNASGSVTVTVNGKSKTVSAGNGQATIEIGRAREAGWRIVANGRSFEDAVVLNRPRVVGAGVFTINALPIGIAYEPPQDPDKLNNNRYTRVTTTATTLSSSFQTSLSTTVPKATSTGSYISMAEGLGAAVGGPAGSALKSIGPIVGRTESDVTTGQLRDRRPRSRSSSRTPAAARPATTSARAAATRSST
jgi:hypothetical protein